MTNNDQMTDNTQELVREYTDHVLDDLSKILSDNGLPPLNSLQYNIVTVAHYFNLGLDWDYLSKLFNSGRINNDDIERVDKELVNQLIEQNRKNRTVELGIEKARLALNRYRYSLDGIKAPVMKELERWYDQQVQEYAMEVNGRMRNVSINRILREGEDVGKERAVINGYTLVENAIDAGEILIDGQEDNLLQEVKRYIRQSTRQLRSRLLKFKDPEYFTEF